MGALARPPTTSRRAAGGRPGTNRQHRLPRARRLAVGARLRADDLERRAAGRRENEDAPSGRGLLVVRRPPPRQSLGSLEQQQLALGATERAWRAWRPASGPPDAVLVATDSNGLANARRIRLTLERVGAPRALFVAPDPSVCASPGTWPCGYSTRFSFTKERFCRILRLRQFLLNKDRLNSRYRLHHKDSQTWQHA